VLGIIG